MITDDVPKFLPLQAAIETAVFGLDDDGSKVNPSDEELREIIESVANALLDPADAKAREVLFQKFREDFGPENAAGLRHWVACKEQAQDQLNGYDAGHPWHYYDQGDNAEPVDVDEIPAANAAHEFVPAKLPKDKKTF